MLSSVGKSFDDLDRITALTNKLGSSVQNYIAARTAIRDYVISVDEKYFAQVQQRIALAVESLAQGEQQADQDETRDAIRLLLNSIHDWSLIARQVRNAFANYQETLQTKVLGNFSMLNQAGIALLHSNPSFAAGMMLDVQKANAAIAGYLFNGEDRFADEMQRAIDSVKTKIHQVEERDANVRDALQTFAVGVNTYEADFFEAVADRNKAYRMFHEDLAPLGVRTQASAEQLHQRLVDQQRKIEELKKAYRALEEVSLTDPLTGLWNRRFLNQHLDADVALTLRHYENCRRHPGQAMPDGADLVFILVDMDHFKSVNDRYGHAAGDQVLVQMRQRLREVFRESDYLVRWGGEEFLVVARGVNRAEAEVLAERVCAAVRERNFELEDGLRLAKTCSVGFACYPFLPQQPRLLSWAQVVELADQALYMAKNSGRNGWVGLFGTDRTRPEEVLRRLAQATAEAVRDGELRLKTSLTGTIGTAVAAV